MASMEDINEVKKQMVIDNSVNWVKAGFTGEDQNITISESSTTHAAGSLQRIKEISGSQKGVFTNSLTGSSKKLDYGFMVAGKKILADEYFETYDISVVTRSISGPATRGTEVSDFWNEIGDKYDIYFVNSGGNDDIRPTVNSAFPLDVATQCAARTSKGYRTYSSEGVSDTEYDIDFCEFVGYQNGTSFAAPGHAQKARMVKQRYGRHMCYDEVYQFFVMSASKEGLPDDKKKIGYGTPIFPDLTKKYIQMDIGNKKFFVDGKTYKEEMLVPPTVKEGTTFVPIRIISELFGAAVAWDQTTKTVTITKGELIIKLAIGSKYIFVNGLRDTLPFAPYIEAGNTMVPLKAITVGLGCGCKWIPDRRRVTILEK